MVIHYLILLLTIVMAIDYRLLLWLLIFLATGYFEVQFLELGFSKVKY
jgi:hypothetical protein